MSGGVAVVQYDTDPLVSGRQWGSGTTVVEPSKDFYSCGVRPGLAVQNTTAATFGHVVSAEEGSFVADISFGTGELYEIYLTDTYGGRISRILTDRRFGRKTTDRAELVDGLFSEDIDADEHAPGKVFGPGEPWKTEV